MCDMKEKIYKVKVIVIDEDENKEVSAETFSHWLNDLEEKNSISGLNEIYRALLKNVEEGTDFIKGEEKTWKCGNCGYLHKGDAAPEACPARAHAQKYFELFRENY